MKRIACLCAVSTCFGLGLSFPVNHGLLEATIRNHEDIQELESRVDMQHYQLSIDLVKIHEALRDFETDRLAIALRQTQVEAFERQQKAALHVMQSKSVLNPEHAKALRALAREMLGRFGSIPKPLSGEMKPSFDKWKNVLETVPDPKAVRVKDRSAWTGRYSGK